MSELARAINLSAPTVTRYLDILEGSFLLHRLPPYFVNIGKRLVKAPKLYFRDSGLLHSLAGVLSYDQLMGSRLVGASWEGYVLEQIRRVAPERWQFFFYRTHTGTEADLVMQAPRGERYLVGIKRSLNASTRGLQQSAEDLQTEKSFVIVQTGESFPRADGSWVYSLSDFLERAFPSLW